MSIQAPPASAGVLGQGIKYPPQFDSKGRLALSWGSDLVDQAILSLCQTQPGERVMQPDYGASSETFEPIGLDRMKIQLEKSIADHEPRAKDVRVDVSLDPDGIPVARVSYSVDGEATERTLTTPIFTGPAATGSSQ